MKSNLLLLLFLFFPVYLFSQGENDYVIYLDSRYTKSNDKDYHFIKVIKDYYIIKEEYTVELYYKSGKLKQIGVSQDKDYSKYNGYLSSFYENGTLQNKVLYKDGKPISTYKSWYENGKKRDEGRYIVDNSNPTNDPILRISQYWDENDIQKVINGQGVYLEQSESLSLSGTLKNGLKDGTWIGKDNDYRITFTENYENGVFISGISKVENEFEHSYSQIFTNPSPKKGMKHFYKFVGNKFNLNFKADETVKIVLTFIVDKNGKIENIKILKGVHPIADQEAIRVLNLYSDWLPGKYRGIEASVSYTLPIVLMKN